MPSTTWPAERQEAATSSQAGLAYDTIRASIVHGRYLPNQKLKVHELAQGLDISPGAVREALFRLVSDKLVETRDQRGFAVAPVSLADLQELTDLRCEIESLACRRSVERGDLDWESGVIAAQYRLRVTSAQYAETGEVTSDFLAAHASFHEALAAAAGNRRLLSVRADLYDQYQRFRVFYANLAGRRHLAADHERLAELALARDADGLVKTMVDHVSQATQRIANAMAGG